MACLSVIILYRTMSAGIRSLRVPLAGPSRPLGRRLFGFNARAPSIGRAGRQDGSGGWDDEARNPVVRDSLVPIVVEQTVSSS